MRVIAGHAKGRKLKGPPQGTRPFMDRNREALFSSLGDHVIDAAVVDLFAGVGSLGLEALSRGAKSAVFVEWSPPAVTILRENVNKIGLGGKVIATDVHDFLEGNFDSFDLAFVDPPYDMPADEVDEALSSLVPHLNAGAVVVLHRRSGESPPVPAGLSLAWEREYGDAKVWRFVKVDEEAGT